MTIARKAFTPSDLQLSETGTVLVAFSRLNVIDHDGDVTFPGALPSGKAVPMSDFGHTSWDGALPVGRGSIREDGDLGIFDGSFFLSTDQGRNAYHTVKAMAELQEWSYGYHILDGGPGIFDGKSVRELRRLDVFEVSPVLIGAGIDTGTLAIKSGSPGPDAPYAEHLSWVRDAVDALVTRTKDRAEWRAKDGRSLSEANVSALVGIRDGLRSLAAMEAELGALLRDADPHKSDRRRRATLAVLLAEAQRLGVPT